MASNSNPLEYAMDKNDCFVIRQGCQYLLRILDRYPMLDREILEFAFWLIGPGVVELNARISELCTRKEAERLQDDLEDCLDYDENARIMMKTIKQDNTKAYKVIDSLIYHLEQRKEQMKSAKNSQLYQNSQKFKELFSMSESEMELCLLFFLVNSWDQFKQLFKSHLEIDQYPGRKYIMTILGLSSSGLEESIQGKLKGLGVIYKRNGDLKLYEEMLTLFIDPDHHVGLESLYQRLQNSDIPLNYHFVCRKEVHFIKSLLWEKNSLSTHILLYGPAGTGKTSFARALANSLSDSTYEILQDNKNESKNRRAALQACLNMTNHGNGSIMIIDEADNLLNTRSNFFFRGEVKDKGWLNSFMEEPGVRAIWIVNDTEEIEESVLRRFSYSLYFSSFSRQKRAQLWKTIAKHNKAGKQLKSQAIQNLAQDYNVSAGVMDLAVKQAMSASRIKAMTFEERVRMGLNAHLKLKNSGKLPKRKNNIDRHFNLEALNVQGDINRTIYQLRTFEERHRQSGNQHISQYNLLFYGPPGTGKSELAKYIAKKLDRDLLIKNSSDLLDKYIGETEKNIAAMFSEAEEKEAVLVLDEADSFLFGRSIAEKSWEVNMVNEFMTQMESYQGILICTTNRFEGMDRASVRRFHQKLFFDYLEQEGVKTFYREFLSNMCEEEFQIDHINRLTKLDKLTPGDFKNVREIYCISKTQITHDILVSALEEEIKIKEKQEGSVKIGF